MLSSRNSHSKVLQRRAKRLFLRPALTSHLRDTVGLSAVTRSMLANSAGVSIFFVKASITDSVVPLMQGWLSVHLSCRNQLTGPQGIVLVLPWPLISLRE
jgi:hypothetical protein